MTFNLGFGDLNLERNYLVIMSFDRFAGRVCPSRSVSARSVSTSRLNLVLSHGLLSHLQRFATVSIYNVVRLLVSSKLIRWRNCVTMAFTVECSPAEEGQYSNQGILRKACWLVRLPLRPMTYDPLFHTHNSDTKGMFYI